MISFPRAAAGFTSFQLKLVAAFLMLLDHVGYQLDIEYLRLLGRFAFPLFAWLLLQGYRHTKNLQSYKNRLLLLAFVSQPIYSYFVSDPLVLNTVFLLWLGLLAVDQINEQSGYLNYLKLSLIIVASIATDYGPLGLTLIIVLHQYKKCLPFYFSYYSLLSIWIIFYPMQLSLIVFPLILNFIEKLDQGIKTKFFYYFYPLHFFPLLLL